MVKRQEIARFSELWSIEHTNDVTMSKFKNRILLVLEGMRRTFSSYPALGRAFRKYSGHAENHASYYEYFFETPLYEAVSNAKDLSQVVEVLQHLIWALQEALPSELQHVVSWIKEAAEASPDIHLHIAGTAAAPILYPGGDPLLDRVAIDDVLQGLSAHPAADKAFRAALQIYLAKDSAKYRNLLDNLRFALEQLIQRVLGNERSLENNKEDFLRWLKDAGLHSYIVQMYHGLIFGGFAKYQNEAVKHGEQYSPSEIEFAIYATGLFMRLIMQKAT
jgi:hypothetical protein